MHFAIQQRIRKYFDRACWFDRQVPDQTLNDEIITHCLHWVIYQQGIMWNQIGQSIGMVGLKMESSYPQELPSIKSKQVINRH